MLFFGIFSNATIDFVPTYRAEKMGSHLAIDPVALAAELNVKSLDSLMYVIAVDMDFDAIYYAISRITYTCQNIRPEIFMMIREKLRTQIVLVGYDVAKFNYERIVSTFAPHVDLLHLLDWTLPDTLESSLRDRVVQGFAPVDGSIFFADDRPRDIDISFVGRTDGHYSFRKQLIDRLEEAGLTVEVAGGDVAKLSKMEYADLFRRSKITLNLSWAAVGGSIDIHPFLENATLVSHLKLRVLEATCCGSLLFEDRNPNTSAVMSPGKHYIEYTFDTVVDLARHYLTHDQERMEIAEAGRNQVAKMYSSSVYWEAIRSRVRNGVSAWRPGTIRRAFVTKDYSTELREISMAIGGCDDWTV